MDGCHGNNVSRDRSGETIFFKQQPTRKFNVKKTPQQGRLRPGPGDQRLVSKVKLSSSLPHLNYK